MRRSPSILRYLRLDALRSNPDSGNGPPTQDVSAKRGRLSHFEILSRSKATSMLPVIRAIRIFAPLTFPVLIVGESGTGKDLVARSLHELSGRSTEPMVTCNVASLTKELIQAELFGHARGSFTGATERRNGLFRQADQGTIFLDEIGDAPPEVQASLLRVIETKKIRAVGSDEESPARARVLCATHRDLTALAYDGKFREDLRFRLSVLTIRLPPLRDRIADLPMLAQGFIQRHHGDLGERELSSGAIEVFSNYSWPGNIRQFHSCVARAALYTDGRMVGSNEAKRAIDEDRGAVLPELQSLPVSDAQLLMMFNTNKGNLTATARELNLARSTVRTRLERLRKSGHLPADSADQTDE